MAKRLYEHERWDRLFHAGNRVEASLAEAQTPIPAHDHEFIQAEVLVGGTCVHRSALGEQTGGPGDVFVCRPGAWHALADCRGLRLYHCCFDAGLLGRELSWMKEDPGLSPLLWGIPLLPAQHGLACLHLPEADLGPCRKLLDELCALSDADFTTYHADKLGLLLQILGLLARHLPALCHARTAKMHRAAAAAMKLIEDNLADPWTLKSLARRVHVEPAYFVRLFRAAAGLPPMAYLNQRRLERSTTLLRQTDLPIGEIGVRVGWDDANYFTRRFHDKFGLPPSLYRARPHATPPLSLPPADQGSQDETRGCL